MTLRAEQEAAAAGRRRGRWRLGIAVAAVLAAVAGLLALAGGRPVSPRSGAYEAGTADPVAATVPVLAGYVEQTRGLSFRKPPSVQVVSAATFGRIVAEPLPADGDPVGDRAATATALGFGTGTAPAAPDAYYSYRRRAVFVPQGRPLDAYLRVVLVRELTLALQDQRFDVAALTRAAAADPDRSRALSALVEGDATRVELAYVAMLPAADQAAVRRRHDYSPTPVSYPQLAAAFPTTAGRDFVGALAGQGGNPAVDAAFGRPPVSTAQVLDPSAYGNGTEPLGVRSPPGEGTRVDAGTLGEFGLAALITGGRRVTNAGAAGRWLGDSYGTFRSGRGLCFYGNIVLADTDSREQLVRDLGRWAAARAGRAEITRSADRGVRLRSCS